MAKFACATRFCGSKGTFQGGSTLQKPCSKKVIGPSRIDSQLFSLFSATTTLSVSGMLQEPFASYLLQAPRRDDRRGPSCSPRCSTYCYTNLRPKPRPPDGYVQQQRGMSSGRTSHLAKHTVMPRKIPQNHYSNAPARPRPWGHLAPRKRKL